MSQLRNLQLFRSEVFVFTDTINTVDLLKVHVEASMTSLKDGEPVVVRYKETSDGEIKSLFGTGYVTDTEHKILWSADEVDVNIKTVGDDYVSFTKTEDPSGNFELSVEANTVQLADASNDNDGLATANDVKSYIYDWRVYKDETTLTWTLQKKALGTNNWVDVDTAWSIDEDLVVESGSVVYLGQDNEGREPGDDGYVETTGDDAYLKLMIRNQDIPVYIKATDLVDVYTAGDGIEITDNEVSVKYANNVEGYNVEFDTTSEGELVAKVDLSAIHEYSEGDNITISDDYVISAVDTITTVVEGDGVTVTPNINDSTHTKEYTISIDNDYINNLIEESYETEEFSGAVNSVLNLNFGDGLTDETVNDERCVSVKISNEEGNIISINPTDKGLIATLDAAVKISDLQVVLNNTNAAKYYTVDAENHIIDTSVADESKKTVPAGEKYLLIATTDKSLYGDKLPETDDTYVETGEIVETENGNTVIRLNRNNSMPVDIDMTDYVVVDAESEYVNTTENPDTIVVSTEGKFTQDVMHVIENYIDNYNCGTFTL